jgi:membrane protein implicated in regulation of membrane protease activity
VNVSTAGAGAPVVSTLEDIGAVIVTVLALLVPVLAAIVIVATFVLAIVLIRRWRRRHRAAAERA